MFQNDNWGQAARFGLFIVGNETVPEAEWWAMLPKGVSVHAARITARTPWAAWDEGRTRVLLADDLTRGARQFAAMQLSAVVIGHSSSSFVGGKGWDEAVVGALTEIVGPDIQVTTNGLDTIRALHASCVQSPFLVMPPWYNDATIQAGVAYYQDQGIEPAGYMRFDLGPRWRDLAPEELYPKGAGFAQELEPLAKQITENVPSAADGVLIVGTGFRCVGVLDMLERKLDCPILSANQASLWRCLSLAGVQAVLPGYGSLLSAGPQKRAEDS